ncbi:MAG: DNA repair protein RecN [Moraxellaceae bacterium]|nr:DNA repair protein RecN [Moraxellaceae bacterium]
MLRRLLIRDFVLVDRLELDFRAGFGALTGETGAGKSILLDALSLLLGERADAAMVRHGCDKADLTAEFELADAAPARAWLAEQDLSGDDDSVALLRRVIDSAGRSRAYVNGIAATATQLRELGDLLADIHGQHAHQALLRPDAQRQLLDAHAGLTLQARELAAWYREWQSARRTREAAEQDQAGLAREREMLEFQVRELTALAFVPSEWEALNQEQARLSNAAELQQGAAAALDAVSEGDTPLAAEAERLAARLHELSAYDDALKPMAELISEAAIRLEEAGHELRRYSDRVDLDPARLAEVDGRIGDVLGLSRKYRVQPEELPGLLSDLAVRLTAIGESGDPVKLAELEAKAHKTYDAAAQKLSKQRAAAATELAAAVTSAMQDLAMSGGRFEIALVPEAAGSANGNERIEFQVAANPSQPLRPLAKVASGGELSRIGLAIQVITSQSQSVPTLIFDEVDVGIGGGVAEVVGRRLRELGGLRQVLCVTHLPQVAAQANWQWRVSKHTEGDVTRSQLVELDDAGRVEEIARMLGGVKITDTTRSHAAELLGLSH